MSTVQTKIFGFQAKNDQNQGLFVARTEKQIFTMCKLNLRRLSTILKKKDKTIAKIPYKYPCYP